MADPTRIQSPPSDTVRPADPARRLSRLWRDGQQPRVADFLAEAGVGDPALIVTVLRVDQWERRRRGEWVPAESYLDAFPAVSDDPERALDVVFAEYLLREQVGESPTLDEYARRFPQYADPLKLQVELHRAMGGDEDGEWPATWVEGPAHPSATWKTESEAGTEFGPGEHLKIPGYEVLGVLGRGGMGVVYRAWQAGLNRTVALKRVHAGAQASPAILARFGVEAEAVARLQHPNVVAIHDVGQHAGAPYLVLELVEGHSLAQRIAGTPQPARWAAELVETLARAIHVAHQQGVLHRDLKPANILLTTEGVPKITDFGLAKLLDGGEMCTQTGEPFGTASYMAPEQATGRHQAIGPATDVYALGAILYELLTGRPPFKAETPLETMRQVEVDEPVAPSRLRPKLPRDLETICLKCLRKEPAQRYPTGEALADDLRRYLAGEPVRARPVGAVGRAARWARRRPAVAALLAVCTTVAAAAFAAVTWEGRQARLAQGLAEAAQEAEAIQRVTAEEAREREAKQRRRYQGLSARLLRDRGLRHCEDGDVGRGLLWLAQSLQLVPDDDLDLQRAIRTNLAGWQEQVHPLLGLLGHEDHVMTAVWSPDGRLILTAGGDRTTRLWDAVTGLRRGRPLRLSRDISAAAFSPNGATVLTVAGQEVRLWNTATGEPAVKQALDLGKGGRILSHAFSPDGCRIWTASRRDQTTWLRSWQADTGRPLGQEVEIGPGVTRLTFSPDGQSFVTAGESREVLPCLWRSSTGKPVRVLKEHTHFGTVVAFNPKDSRSFVTGSYDRTCRLWDTATGELLRPPFRHLAEVRSVAFSPNGRTILTGGNDGFAQFWDVVKGSSIGAPMRHPDAVGPVGFSPDGRFALTVSRDQVRLWDTTTGDPLGAPLPHQKEVLGASFGPDGRAVLTRSRDSTVRIWQTAPARPGGRRLAHNGWVTTVAFRPPAGESFLTGLGAREGKVLSWDIASDRKPDVSLDRLGPVLSLAYRPDGRIVAVGIRDRQVRLWDVQTGRPALGDPLALDDKVLAVAFSPDGRTLLTGTGKRRAAFWDVATGAKQPESLGHDKAVYAVAYSPDGRAVLTGSEDMTARLWDAATHKPLGVSLGHQGTVYAVAFRPPDGQVLLTGSEDRTARLWDAATGRPLGAPFQHPSRVLAVAFTPDGRTFATGCGDGTARLWDAATGHAIGRPLPHRGPVRAVAFGPHPRDSADGGHWTLVTGSEDKTARIWEVPAPLGGSPDWIMISLQAATGLILDDQGVVDSLPPVTWRRLRRESVALGGPR